MENRRKRRIWNQLITLFRDKTTLDDQTMLLLTDEIIKIIEGENCFLPEGSHCLVMRDADRKQFRID